MKFEYKIEFNAKELDILNRVLVCQRENLRGKKINAPWNWQDLSDLQTKVRKILDIQDLLELEEDEEFYEDLAKFEEEE